MTARLRIGASLAHMTLAAGSLIAPHSLGQAAQDDMIRVQRSQLNRGDATRLRNAFAKARRGDQLTVAVIGGSITAGARASRHELNYGNLLADWWRETFPQTRINAVNAGIGATGSNYAALRARRDLLTREPDVVVVEFAVNDGNTETAAESLEGLLRQILGHPRQPAVILLFMMHRGGGNAQEWHGRVGDHYRLPMVSFRDGLWPDIEVGRLAWEDVEADAVHPNDRGHAYAARFVSHLLDTVLADTPADWSPRPPAPLPQPLISDLYEHVALYEAPGLEPETNNDWTLQRRGNQPGWICATPGATAAFSIPGTAVCLMEWRIRGPMGKARVQVDAQPPLVRDAWFDQTWGGYRLTAELARGLPPALHRVHVTVLDEKHPESTGHEYCVLGLGALGISPPPPAVLRHHYPLDRLPVSDHGGPEPCNGDIVGTPRIEHDATHGPVLRFEGTDSIRFPPMALPRCFSISAWIRLEDNPVPPDNVEPAGRQQIAMILGTSPMQQRDGILLFVNNPWGPDMDGILQLEVWRENQVARIESRRRLTIGTWHHITVAADARDGAVSFFVDGKAEPVQVKGRPELGAVIGTRPWRLAASADGACNLHGRLHDVRIYAGLLERDNIAALAAP